MESRQRASSENGEGGPMEAWRPGEVWFRDLIRSDLPWGNEDNLEIVPSSAAGSYGVKVGAATRVDGQTYEKGEVVVVDTREDLMRLLPALGTATDLIFPWYERMVPAALVSPHQHRVDLAAYRSEFGARFLKALVLTVGLVALGFVMPELLMISLLGATLYGLYPLIDAGMSWLRRVDRFSVEELNRRLVNFELFRRWILTRRSSMLKVGVGVLVLVFVGQMLAGLDPSIDAAALVKKRVLEQGEWWRIVTTGLMHGSVVHILFNGMALYSLGRVLVSLVCPSLLSFVFLFTVVTGSLASLWFGPGGPDAASVGASGGILGCLGFLLVVTSKFKALLPGFLQSSLIQSTLVVAIFGALGSAFIDNAAHAGGFLGGILLGVIIAPWMRLAPTTTKLPVRVLSVLSLTIMMGGVVKIAWELWKLGS